MQDVRIVKEDEMEQYLNKRKIQLFDEEFAPDLKERADDVSRGENNVEGEKNTASFTTEAIVEIKKQTCDTSNSCWEEIPLDDSNDHDIPSGSGSSFEVATTSPSPSVNAVKE